MRFGHYTVFDTPEENKHTQVYVEYDVPNNDDLEGATGTIVLTEGGQGSGDAKNGIRSITIEPALDVTPALESYFPIYWEDLTDEQKDSGVEISSAFEPGTIHADDTWSITITPTSDWYVYDFEAETFNEKGAPYTTVIAAESADGFTFQFGAASNTAADETTKLVAVTMAVEEV